MIGGALGGPIGAIAGSFVGDFLMDKVGQHLASEAYSRRVSAKTVVGGQVGGALIGAALGVAGAALLIGAGVIAATVALPVLLVAAGIGLIGGAIVGGYSMLFGKKKVVKEDKTRRLSRERTKWGSLHLASLSRDDNNEQVNLTLKQGEQKIAYTEGYLRPTSLEDKPKSQELAKKLEEKPIQERKPWWEQAFSSVKSIFTGLWQGVKSTAKQLTELMGRIGQFALDKAKKALSGAAKIAGGVGDAIKGAAEATGIITPPAAAPTKEQADQNLVLESMRPTGRSYIRMVNTSQKDQYGANMFMLQLVDAKGAIKDRMMVVSGVPSRQALRKAKDSVGGSLEPVPEGVYNLGRTEWGNHGSALGPLWVDVNPTMATGRGAIGIHLDANRSYSPGTAGCVGILSKADLNRVSTWINGGAHQLIVDYSLGTIPGQYKPDPRGGRKLVPGTELNGPATKVQSVKGGIVLNETEMYRLAALAVMEAPTRMGRLDVTQAVFNRIASGQYGGKSVTGVAFARGQFEPYFGVSPSQIQGSEGAIAVLQRKRGMSRAQAIAELNQYISDLGDPIKMADARKHVGGRTDFKGTTMYGYMSKKEDRLRTYGENFFHISPGQSYSQLSKYEAAGPVSIRLEGTAAQVAAVPNTKQKVGAAGTLQKVTYTTDEVMSKPSQVRGMGVGKINPYLIYDSNRGNLVNSYAGLSRHHEHRGHEEGRSYGREGGHEEEIRKLSDGRVLVKKDMVLEQNGTGSVAIPAPAAGYVRYLNDGYNTVQIFSDPQMQHMTAQILHMRSVSVKTGQQIKYGQRIGVQGDTGSPGAIHTHLETDVNTFKEYISSLRTGKFGSNQGAVTPGDSQGIASLVPGGQRIISDYKQPSTVPTEAAPPPPALNKRRRGTWQQSSLPPVDVEAIRRAASPPIDTRTVQQVVATSRVILDKATDEMNKRKRQPIAVRVSKPTNGSAVAMDTTCPSSRKPCIRTTVTQENGKTAIQVEDQSFFLREVALASGMQVGSEYRLATG
jgi:hypothetical protein